MNLNDDIQQILIKSSEIQQRVKELSAEIVKDYRDEDVIFVCILKGAVRLLVDLARNIDIPVTFDFMEVSSYKGSRSTGIVRITKDLKNPIDGKNILIVEDILDTGLTLSYIKRMLKTRNPKSVKICTLLNKKDARIVDVKLDYFGFAIPNKFVVGYGLDYKERYRNLNYIGILKESIYKRRK